MIDFFLSASDSRTILLGSIAVAEWYSGVRVRANLVWFWRYCLLSFGCRPAGAGQRNCVALRPSEPLRTLLMTSMTYRSARTELFWDPEELWTSGP